MAGNLKDTSMCESELIFLSLCFFSVYMYMCASKHVGEKVSVCMVCVCVCVCIYIYTLLCAYGCIHRHVQARMPMCICTGQRSILVSCSVTISYSFETGSLDKTVAS